jgi:protein-L-isoaspartate(D-aspartate) O-methyltransferase
MARVGADNTAIVDGDLRTGAPSHGPYNAIILNGAAEKIPDELRNQLADGGRLVAVQVQNRIGKAMVIERYGDIFGTRDLFDAATPLLPGFTSQQGFVF